MSSLTEWVFWAIAQKNEFNRGLEIRHIFKLRARRCVKPRGRAQQAEAVGRCQGEIYFLIADDNNGLPPVPDRSLPLRMTLPGKKTCYTCPASCIWRDKFLLLLANHCNPKFRHGKLVNYPPNWEEEEEDQGRSFDLRRIMSGSSCEWRWFMRWNYSTIDNFSFFCPQSFWTVLRISGSSLN